MSYLLYFIILTGFCILIARASFFKKSGLAWQWLVFFFLIRAVTGLINCYLSYHYFKISDSLTFHNIGLNEYHQLTTNTKYFFTETFTHYGNNYSGLLDTSHSFWNNLKENIIVKTLAILNIFTFRNFYINTLLFNTTVFIGSVALFKSLNKVYPKKKILSLVVFLFPSGLFFTSTIHRDGLVWMCLGIIIYTLSRLFSNGYKLKRLIFFFLAFLLIFLLRNYLAFIIIPGVIAWWLAEKNKDYTLSIYGLITVLSVLMFFTLRNFIPAADFPQFVANRQSSFNEISEVSRTYLPLSPLTDDFTSYLKILPAAFTHVFLMPFVWKMDTLTELPFAIESIALIVLFAIWLLKGKFKTAPIVLFILFISLISLIIIGITVPNLGAIIRYKSIYFHFLFILLFCSISYRK